MSPAAGRLLSMDAERAGERIVRAVLGGRTELVLTTLGERRPVGSPNAAALPPPAAPLRSSLETTRDTPTTTWCAGRVNERQHP